MATFHFVPHAATRANPIGKLLILTPTVISFFMLASGFLLAFRYRLLFDRPKSITDYWWRRFSRLGPLYFATWVVAMVIFVGSANFGAERPGIGLYFFKNAILSFMLLQAWSLDLRAMDVNGPTWTLSAEVAMYAALPFFIVAFRRVPRLRHAVHALVFMTVLGVLLLIFESTADKAIALARWPPYQASSFLVGVLMGLAFAEHPQGYTNAQRRTFLYVGTLFFLGVAIVVPYEALHAAYPLLITAASLPPLACVLFGLMDGPVTDFTKGLPRLFREFGDPSYAIYVLHVPIGVGLSYLSIIVGLDLRIEMPWVFLSMVLVLVLLVSIVSSRYFEPWAREAIMKWYENHLSRSSKGHVSPRNLE